MYQRPKLKKLPEKPKPNGRTVEVPEDEVVRNPRSITAKQAPETDKKNEKSKKNKKKSKSDAKAVQNSSRHDGKEVDEGAWETKISHREKRQQRKRDKVLTDSGSLDSTIPGIEGKFHYSPAYVVNCVDTTGAGDVFHGAFCYAVH